MSVPGVVGVVVQVQVSMLDYSFCCFRSLIFSAKKKLEWNSAIRRLKAGSVV